MTYKREVKKAMTKLGKRSKTVFLGENIINAGRIYGTLDGVPLSKCIEMPICENLIAGAAIGLALEGYRPIVVFQRMDFMLIAADAIINHMGMIPRMSGWKVQLPILIRAIIGSRKHSFDVGAQHQQDHTLIFKKYIATHKLNLWSDIKQMYATAYEVNEPVLIVEDRDLYDEEKGDGS